MADIPASALLGQFAEEVTPAGHAVFGLKAQPFADNHSATLGDVHDAERGNVSITLARKASLVAECQRLGLSTTGTAATLRSALQRANTRVMTQIAADWVGFSDADIADGLTDPTGVIDISAMTFSSAIIEIAPSLAVSLAVSIAVSLGMRDDTREPIPHSRRMEEEGVGSRSGRRRVERRVRL